MQLHRPEQLCSRFHLIRRLTATRYTVTWVSARDTLYPRHYGNLTVPLTALMFGSTGPFAAAGACPRTGGSFRARGRTASSGPDGPAGPLMVKLAATSTFHASGTLAASLSPAPAITASALRTSVATVRDEALGLPTAAVGISPVRQPASPAKPKRPSHVLAAPGTTGGQARASAVKERSTA